MNLKAFFSLAALFVSFSVVSQDVDEMSLQKYSYPIVARFGDSLSAGTGFFFHQKKKLFFVTAYHVVSGCDTYQGGRHSNWPDSMYILLPDSSYPYKKYAIPVAVYKNSPCKMFDKAPDIAAINVTGLLPTEKVFAIDNLLHSAKKTSQHNESFWAFGYPGFFQAYPYALPTSQFFIGALLPLQGLKYHGIPPSISKLYLIIIPPDEHGFSGAPIFEKLFDSSNNQFFEFSGVISGANTVYGHSFLVRREVAIAFMNQLK